jgi:glycosyltransferase involved in cell wall biosynthesis
VTIPITVMMPARNVEPYIDEAIRSVLEQKGVCFELRIIDDASTDGTWGRIQTYRQDQRVHVSRLRKRRGAACVRNLILKSARGVHIVPCDADDKMLPGYLKILYQSIHKSPSIGVAFLRRFWQQKGRRVVLSRLVSPPDQAWDLLGKHSLGHPGTIIRTALMCRIGGYDPNLPFLQDYDLFLKLAEIASFRGIPGKPLFFYRKRKGTISDCSSEQYRMVFQSVVRRAIYRRYRLRFK